MEEGVGFNLVQDVCANSDQGPPLSSNGGGCQYHADNNSPCNTNFDDDDWFMLEMCCHCGGGQDDELQVKIIPSTNTYRNPMSTDTIQIDRSNSHFSEELATLTIMTVDCVQWHSIQTTEDGTYTPADFILSGTTFTFPGGSGDSVTVTSEAIWPVECSFQEHFFNLIEGCFADYYTIECTDPQGRIFLVDEKLTEEEIVALSLHDSSSTCSEFTFDTAIAPDTRSIVFADFPSDLGTYTVRVYGGRYEYQAPDFDQVDINLLTINFERGCFIANYVIKSAQTFTDHLNSEELDQIHLYAHHAQDYIFNSFTSYTDQWGDGCIIIYMVTCPTDQESWNAFESMFVTYTGLDGLTMNVAAVSNEYAGQSWTLELRGVLEADPGLSDDTWNESQSASVPIQFFVFYNCHDTSPLDEISAILTATGSAQTDLAYYVQVGGWDTYEIDFDEVTLIETSQDSACSITGYTLEQKNWGQNSAIALQSEDIKYDSLMMQLVEPLTITFNVDQDTNVNVASDGTGCQDAYPLNVVDCDELYLNEECSVLFPHVYTGEYFCTDCGGGVNCDCQLADVNTKHCLEEIYIYPQSHNGTLPILLYTKLIVYTSECNIAEASQNEWSFPILSFSESPPFRMHDVSYQYDMPIVVPTLSSGADSIATCGPLLYEASLPDSIFTQVPCDSDQCIEVLGAEDYIADLTKTYDFGIQGSFQNYPSIDFIYFTVADLQVTVFDCRFDLDLDLMTTTRDQIIFPVEDLINTKNNIVLNTTDNAFYAIADWSDNIRIGINNVGQHSKYAVTGEGIDCGAAGYEMSVSGGNPAPNINLNQGSNLDPLLNCENVGHQTSSCFVQLSTIDKVPDDTLTFSLEVSNPYFTFPELLVTDVSIILVECSYYPIVTGSYTKENFDMKDPSQLNSVILWEEFTQPHPACVIDSYVVECTQPDNQQASFDRSGEIESSSATGCQAFEYSFFEAGDGYPSGNTNDAQRQILLTQAKAQSVNEGTYTFEIRGFHASIPDVLESIAIYDFTLYADCSSAESLVTFTGTQNFHGNGSEVLTQQVLKIVQDFLMPFTSTYPHTCKIQYSLHDYVSGQELTRTNDRVFMIHIESVKETTQVGGQKWSTLKESAMLPAYKTSQEYLELSENKRLQVDTLIAAQTAQGDNELLEETPHNFPVTHSHYQLNSPGTLSIFSRYISNADAYAEVFPAIKVLELRGELLFDSAKTCTTTFNLQIDRNCAFGTVYLEGEPDIGNQWEMQIGQKAAGEYEFTNFDFQPREVIQDIGGELVNVSATCVQTNADYVMLMTNPDDLGDKIAYDVNILQFIPDESAVPTDIPTFVRVHLKAITDTLVQIYRNGQVYCDLSDPYVKQCDANIEIYTKLTEDDVDTWENSVYDDLRLVGSATFTIKSECFTMSNLPSVWNWLPEEKDAFNQGYQVRDPKLVLNMPWVEVTLSSGDDLTDICGPTQYLITQLDDNCALTCQYAIEQCKESCPCSAEAQEACSLVIDPIDRLACQASCTPICSLEEELYCNDQESVCQVEIQCNSTDTNTLSDLTGLGDSTWEMTKLSVMQQGNYDSVKSSLITGEQKLLDALIAAQEAQGDMGELTATPFRDPFNFEGANESANQQPQIEVLTYNSIYSAFISPFFRIYQFKVEMGFTVYLDEPEVPNYSTVDGFLLTELQFKIYDGCIQPVWNTPTIKFGADQSELDIQDASEDLSVTIYVKDDEKMLSFFQYRYLNLATMQYADCGNPTAPTTEVVYTVNHVSGITTQPSTGFDVHPDSNEDGFKFMMSAEENELIGIHNFTIYVSFTAITQNALLYNYDIGQCGKLFPIVITVMPCYVKEFLPRPDIVDFTINLNELPTRLAPFQTFEQVPTCGYAITYTITVMESSPENIFNDFKEEFESTQPSPPLVTFYPNTRISFWQCTSDSQVDQYFDVFINGEIQFDEELEETINSAELQDRLAENDEQRPYMFSDFLRSDGETDQAYSLIDAQIPKFRVKVGIPLILIDNSPPELDADQSVVISPGDIFTYYVQSSDFEKNDIYIDSWSSDVSPDWMKFTNATTIGECNFEFFPPANTEDTQITISLILGDNHETLPLLSSSQFVNVKVVRPEVEIFEFSTIVDEEEDDFSQIPAPVMSYESIEELVLMIKFSDIILYPEGIRNFTNSNEGQQVFEIQYWRSEATVSYLYENDIHQIFDWYIEDLDPQNIKIKLRFSDYSAVSTDSMDEDMITFKVRQKDLFVGAQNKKPIQISRFNQRSGRRRRLEQIESDPILPSVADVDADFKIYMKPRPIMPLETKELLESTADAFATAISAAVGANVLVGLFMAGALQYMWGMIHSLQMIVITALFDLYTPTNANIIMVSILQLTAYDFYQTEELYGEVLGLKQGSSLNPIFENCGFDGSNFIIGIGPLFITYIIFPLYVLIHRIFRYFFKDQVSYSWVNKFLEEKNYTQAVLFFLVESCLEIGLTGLISLKIRSTEENFGNFWNTVSTLLAIISVAGLIASPIYFMYASYKYHKYYDEDVTIREKYHPLFEEFYRKSIYAINYPTVFFLRRYALVIVLVFFNKSTLLQINLICLTCIFILSYVALHKPFKEPFRDIQETFNEINVLLACYPLFYYTSYSPSELLKYRMGWATLSCIAFNMALNITIILIINGGKIIRKLKLWNLKREHKQAMADRIKKQAEDVITYRRKEVENEARLRKLFPGSFSKENKNTIAQYNEDRSVLERISEIEESKGSAHQSSSSSSSNSSNSSSNQYASAYELRESVDHGFIGRESYYENFNEKVQAQDLMINAKPRKQKPRKFRRQRQRIGIKAKIHVGDRSRNDDDLADKYIRDIVEGRSPYMNDREESKDHSNRTDSSRRYKAAQLELLNDSAKYSVNNISLIDYDEPVADKKTKRQNKNQMSRNVTKQFPGRPGHVDSMFERRGPRPFTQYNNDWDGPQKQALDWQSDGKLIVNNPNANIPTPMQYKVLKENHFRNNSNTFDAQDTGRTGFELYDRDIQNQFTTIRPAHYVPSRNNNSNTFDAPDTGRIGFELYNSDVQNQFTTIYK